MRDIIIVLGLLACVTALVPLADRWDVPYPILLVLGGLALGFVPNTILPDIVLAPDLVFVLFLPPLLYWATLTTPWREFRRFMRPILLLAVGLVVATMVTVAAAAHAVIPGLDWSLALVLGAIVSPPDAVAATAIAERLGLPTRVSVILEGESLVNDATALVAYGTAVAVVSESSLSPIHVGGEFLWAVVGGIITGLLVGWVIAQLRKRMDNPLVESAVSLLTPFAAYLPAYLVGASGVLSVVVMGFVVQQFSPLISGSQSRLQAGSVWKVVNFLLNGLVFILIGLQLHPIFLDVVGHSLPHLIWEAAIVSLTAIGIRIVWIVAGGALFRRFSRNNLTPRESTALSWAGMRGVVSLAAAQALPVSFPARNLILFLTFGVILSTLVVQGLTLPMLIRRLGLAKTGVTEREETQARLAAAEAALAYLDEVARRGGGGSLLEDLRSHYTARAQVLSDHASENGDRTTETHSDYLRHLELIRDLLQVERETIVQLRNEGRINDEAMRRIQRDLDLEDVRLSPS
jgi:CPA1 family monovalent cation:H+ antiporter